MRRNQRYIHELDSWPKFHWDNGEILALIGQVRNLQGQLIGKMESVGFELKTEATMENIALEIIKSSEIEGEILNTDEVRSSLARKLGINKAGLVPSGRDVDGIVDLMIDATHNHQLDLTQDRLLNWHSSLFPTGHSGLYKIIVGNWRDDSTGPMQVISGALGKEKFHFEAPAALRIAYEMSCFLQWVNQENKLDPVLKAGIAHLWFITIHPFEDGNGRIARALTEMLLTRSDGVSQRFYSMSSQIRLQRKEYYEILEQTQKGNLDIHQWLEWFLLCLSHALNASSTILNKVLYKHDFWLKNAKKPLNDRQRKMLNKLLDDFIGKLTTKKWAKMMKCSHDTALRDINALISFGILRKEQEGGRSTNYELVPLAENTR